MKKNTDLQRLQEEDHERFQWTFESQGPVLFQSKSKLTYCWIKISLLLPRWSWPASGLHYHYLNCATPWMGSTAEAPTSPIYLQAPLRALLSSKVRYIQRRRDKQISCNTRHICFPEHTEKTDFPKKRAIHHTLRLHSDINQSRRTAAAASSWASHCCERSTSSVSEIKTQCCFRKHRGNQYVRALKSSPQPSATKWKYMEKSPYSIC